MGKIIRTYLDENRNSVSKDKAVFMVETEFDDFGNVVKERWQIVKRK
jgi:hypothetical protein